SGVIQVGTSVTPTPTPTTTPTPQPAGYTVVANASGYQPGASATVNWTSPTATTGSDWIGLYEVGAPNNAIIQWQWASAGTSGSNMMTMPTTPGSYEFRYFTDNSYTVVATSGVVSVDITQPLAVVDLREIYSNPFLVTKSTFGIFSNPSGIGILSGNIGGLSR
ncbi:MAG: hypothetical protein ACK5NT_14520, partial [Pyrinomonadaceae bacterium]